MFLNPNAIGFFIAFFLCSSLLATPSAHACDIILKKEKLSQAEITETLECANDQLYLGNFKHLTEIICGLEGKIDKNTYEEGLLYFYKGWFHSEKGNFAEAKYDQDQIREIIPYIGNKHQATLLKIYILNIQNYNIEFTDGSFEKETKNAKEILKLTESLSSNLKDYNFQKARAAYILAYKYYNRNMFKQGDPYLKLMQTYSKKTTSPFFKIRENKLVATYYIKKKEVDSALKYFDIADKLALKENYQLERYYMYPMLANAYNEKKDYKKAADYAQRYKVKNDSITISKNLAYDILLKCSEQHAQTIARNKYIAYGTLGLLLLGFGIFLIKRNSKKKVNEQIFYTESTSPDDLETLVTLAKDNPEAFYVKFPEIYPELYEKLNTAEPKFSSSEIKFCMYLKMKLTTKEIALYTNSTIKSVENKKYRIRKKLDISSDADIYHAIDTL